MSFDFILTELFVWGYCATILMFAIWHGGRLIRATRKLHAKLRQLIDELDSISGQKDFANSLC